MATPEQKPLDYWAAKPTDEAVAAVEGKIETYYENIRDTGLLYLWQRACDAYHMALQNRGLISSIGTHGELAQLDVNQFRNFIDHMTTMAVQQRPAFEPRATNTDVKSQSQTILARGLLDYYMREKKLEQRIKKAVMFACLFGEGFVRTDWDATAGEQYSTDPDTNEPLKQGDIVYSAYDPSCVIRDTTAQSFEDLDWICFKTFVNRFTLMARYPEFTDKLTGTSNEQAYRDSIRTLTKLSSIEDSDLIPVYHFYHKKTDALPEGRVLHFVDSDTVFVDGPLPFRDLSCFRITGSEMLATPFGYSVSFDILGLQEAVNTLHSTIFTNQETFGVQNVMVPRGSNLSVSELSGGLNLIEFDQQMGPPQPLNLTATPPEVFNYLQQLEHTMETLTGINSVARGNPEASLKSGAALALVQSQAIQFSQGIQNSYIQLLEGVGTSTINILRDFATVPRVAMIAGKAQRGMMREFKGDDLSSVNRVIVDAGNAMSRTSAGKVQIAQDLLQSGVIKTADEYLMVMETGNLDPLTEGPTNELLGIRAENEALSNGRQVPVMITDSHMLHINEHKAIMSDPEVRADGNLVMLIGQHIQEHVAALSNPSNAVLLQLLGQQPVPPQAPQAPQGQGVAQGPAGQTGAQPSANDMAGQMLPNPPKNALTGQLAQLPPGSPVDVRSTATGPQ